MNENHEGSMDIQKINTGNVILAAILVTLIFLCVEQRSSIKNTQESQDKLYALMRSHAGHVWTEDLKKEGRRLAFAQHFINQVLKGNDRWNYKKLLEHGSEGIESYLSLQGGSEVTNSAEYYASTNSAYVWQLAMATYFPVITGAITYDKKTDENRSDSERDRSQLEKGEESNDSLTVSDLQAIQNPSIAQTDELRMMPSAELKAFAAQPENIKI